MRRQRAQGKEQARQGPGLRRLKINWSEAVTCLRVISQSLRQSPRNHGTATFDRKQKWGNGEGALQTEKLHAFRP